MHERLVGCGDCVHPGAVDHSARKLRLLVRTANGALPMLVAAGIAPFTACGVEPARDGTRTGGGAGGETTAQAGLGGASEISGGVGQGGVTGGTGGLGGNPNTGGGIVITFGGFTTGGASNCYGDFEEFTVEFPPEGVPAEPGQICAATTDPVGSYRAARVTLTTIPDDPLSALGVIEIDPNIAGDLVGLPVVEVVEATDNTLSDMMVTEILARPEGGFSFRASWSVPIQGPIESEPYSTRMSVRTVLQLRCAPDSSTTKRVHALTEIYRCMQDRTDATPIWVSSGDSCIVCRIIAEMAPSPIVPDKQSDELPLAKALRLRIVELARVSNTLVLLAENDGGDGLEYEWHPTGGRVEKLAPDVIAWTLEPGCRAPIIQVAVMGPNAAAVASRGFYEAA